MYNEQYGNIMVFDAEYFEAILDDIATTRSGRQLWEFMGTIKGEKVYHVGMGDSNNVQIRVRSSIHGNVSAESGKDSIRAWLVLSDGSPLSAKVSEYVTRRPGWERRLKETFTKLRKLRLRAGNCCGQPQAIFKARKNGRLFCKCLKCKSWDKWLT